MVCGADALSRTSDKTEGVGDCATATPHATVCSWSLKYQKGGFTELLTWREEFFKSLDEFCAGFKGKKGFLQRLEQRKTMNRWARRRRPPSALPGPCPGWSRARASAKGTFPQGHGWGVAPMGAGGRGLVPEPDPSAQPPCGRRSLVHCDAAGGHGGSGILQGSAALQGAVGCAGASVGGTPRGSCSACKRRDDRPTLTDRKR